MTRSTNCARLGSSESPSRSRFLATTTGIVAAALIAFVPIASAGKPTTAGGGGRGGGGKPSSADATLTLVLVEPTDGVPNWDDELRFDVTAPTSEPHVDLNCAQDGELVYIAQTGYYEGYPWPWTQTFRLVSGAWTGGAADCTATLYWYDGRKTVTGAVQEFHVLA